MSPKRRPVPPPPLTEEAWEQRLQSLLVRLGLPPEAGTLVRQALTHRSVAATQHNERLELLGDAVLDYFVIDHLYHRFPQHPEGQLTQMKIRVVQADSLADAARRLDLAPMLRIGQGEEQTGARTRPSLLGDCFEAMIAAVYLAAGLEAARAVAHRELIDLVDPTVDGDHKSRLQELTQERFKQTPSYETRAIDGPDHALTFSSTVRVQGQELGIGTGSSKREAEQRAAGAALDSLKK